MKLASPPRLSTACSTIPLLVLLLTLVSGPLLYSQGSVHSREEDSLAYAGMKLIDAGDFAGARQILKQGEKLYPANSGFPYELAYILYMEEKYDECQRLLLTIIDAPDANARYYQLLGNTYDLLGDPAGAIKVYERGLGLFPKSGPLHLERGIMSAKEDDIPAAIKFWEQGIAGEPSFPSNYYYAAMFWMKSTNPGWGLIYGEIFANLEPAGPRFKAMRNMLFAGWSSAISKRNGATANGGDTINASMLLFKETIVIADSSTQTLRYPFTLFYSGMMMGAAFPYLLTAGPLTIADLHAIRADFIKRWFERSDISSHFAVDLFERHRKLAEAGLLEAYDYAIFESTATADEVAAWRANNMAKVDRLQTWLYRNRYSVAPEYAFSRPTLILRGLPMNEGEFEGFMGLERK